MNASLASLATGLEADLDALTEVEAQVLPRAFLALGRGVVHLRGVLGQVARGLRGRRRDLLKGAQPCRWQRRRRLQAPGSGADAREPECRGVDLVGDSIHHPGRQIERLPWAHQVTMTRRWSPAWNTGPRAHHL